MPQGAAPLAAAQLASGCVVLREAVPLARRAERATRRLTLSPRVSVRRTWALLRIPLAARVAKSALVICARGMDPSRARFTGREEARLSHGKSESGQQHNRQLSTWASTTHAKRKHIMGRPGDCTTKRTL